MIVPQQPLAADLQPSASGSQRSSSGNRGPSSPCGMEPTCTALDRCAISQPQRGDSGNASAPENTKPTLTMPKVRVLRRENSSGQVSPSANTSICDGPRPPSDQGPAPAVIQESDAPSSEPESSTAGPAAAASNDVSATGASAPPMMDLANPGLDLHKFIVDTVNMPKDRMFMLSTEQTVLNFLSPPPNNSRRLLVQQLKIATSTSYHRMLVHRIGAYFGMDHMTDSTEDGVILQRTARTRLPEQRFKDLLQPKTPTVSNLTAADMNGGSGNSPSAVVASPRIILKRQDAPNSAASGSSTPASAPGSGNEDRKQMTIEEREAAYEEHRKRIFSQHPAVSTVGETTEGSVTATSTSSPTTSTTSLSPSGGGKRSSPVHESAPVVDADYDRSLPVSTSDATQPCGGGGGKLGRSLRRQPGQHQHNHNGSHSNNNYRMTEGLWRAAGPGVLQAEGGSNHSRGSSQNDSNGSDSGRQRYDKQYSTSTHGGHGRLQGRNSSRNSSNNKPQSLIPLSSQQPNLQQQQRWSAAPGGNVSPGGSGIGGSARGLMHSAVGGKQAQQQHYGPRMVGIHSPAMGQSLMGPYHGSALPANPGYMPANSSASGPSGGAGLPPPLSAMSGPGSGVFVPAPAMHQGAAGHISSPGRNHQQSCQANSSASHPGKEHQGRSSSKGNNPRRGGQNSRSNSNTGVPMSSWMNGPRYATTPQHMTISPPGPGSSLPNPTLGPMVPGSFMPFQAGSSVSDFAHQYYMGDATPSSTSQLVSNGINPAGMSTVAATAAAGRPPYLLPGGIYPGQAPHQQSGGLLGTPAAGGMPSGVSGLGYHPMMFPGYAPLTAAGAAVGSGAGGAPGAAPVPGPSPSTK